MGRGHWGGGVSITNRLLLGGSTFKLKFGRGGGVAEEMMGLPKNCPAPPQLINNDRSLSLLHSIARSENSRIKCLMGRQLTLQCQKSFFCKAEKILELYDLPRSAELHNYSKLAWKKLTRQAVNRYWTQTLISEARTKSTLANCDVTTLAIGNTHIVWEAASNNVHDVRRSIPKVRMLAGVYMLQTNKASFNQ